MVVLIMVVIIIFTERNLSGGGGEGAHHLLKFSGLIKTLRCFQLIHFVIITTYFLSGFRIYQARNSLN